MNLFSLGCVLFDCTAGTYRMVEKTPFKIGSGDDCDWRIDDPQVAAEHCVIQRKSNTYYLLSSAGTEGVLLPPVGSVPQMMDVMELGNPPFECELFPGICQIVLLPFELLK